jgi:hypothetical protein
MDADSASEASSSSSRAATAGSTEPAAVRYARLKQRTQATGSAIPPSTGPVQCQGTSVYIATAFSQARAGPYDRPANDDEVRNGHVEEQDTDISFEGASDSCFLNSTFPLPRRRNVFV